VEQSRPIGLFDSGIGGLTVLQEVRRLLPNESVLYFGDTAYVPYGSRAAAELVALGHRIIDFLVGMDVKYVIFACNTSSSISLGILRQRFRVPMVGLVEPGAAAAVRATRNGRVGLLATEATVRAGAYERAMKSMAPDVRVFSQAAPRLVPLVEAGQMGTPAAREAVAEYLTPLLDKGIDTLLLGCTHYPFLLPEILEVSGTGLEIVDPAAATVAEARREMERLSLLNNPSSGGPRYSFFVSGDPEAFAHGARTFLGFRPEVTRVYLPVKCL